MNRQQRMESFKQEDQIFMDIRAGNLEKICEYIDAENGNSSSNRKGSSKVQKSRWSGWTLLHRAAERGHTDVCEVLLDRGAKVNGRTALGWYTPLHICLANGWTDTADMLVTRGADIYAQSKYKETPVQYASKRGYQDISHQFLEKILRERTLQATKEKMNSPKKL